MPIYLRFLFSTIYLCFSFSLFSQNTISNHNIVVRGEVIDIVSNKPLSEATITLIFHKKDTFQTSTATHSEAILLTSKTDSLGKVQLQIPANILAEGDYFFSISAINYVAKKKKIFSYFDDNLANDSTIVIPVIGLVPSKDLMNEIQVVGEKSQAKISIAKQTYNVEKNLVAQGGTAIDAIRNVPILNVDIDGNIQLRNSRPDIFIDGRPTTLTLDQIPVENIDKIEVITNPPAKYRASGSGIVNLIMKKNSKKGHMANTFLGVDSRKAFRLGGGYNFGNKKWETNIFGLLVKRVSFGDGDASRFSLLDSSDVKQVTGFDLEGYFGLFRAGVKRYFNPNNILELQLSFRGGDFFPDNKLISNYYSNVGTQRLITDRFTDREINFRVFTPKLSYIKKLKKEGAEFTTDVSVDFRRFQYDNEISTKYYTASPFNVVNNKSNIFQNIDAVGLFVNAQSDLVYPLDRNKKFETGIQFIQNTVNVKFRNYFRDENVLTLQESGSNDYKLTTLNYSGYLALTHSLEKFSYQAGLRVEGIRYDSDIRPSLNEDNQFYTIDFPFQLFPSLYANYKINEKQQLQISYTRRIKRPHIRQLVPFINYTDSINISKGNQTLNPEFSHLIDMSYIYDFMPNSSLLLSYYFKYTDNLISVYQIQDSINFSKKTIVNTYINANESIQHGFELVTKIGLTSWLDIVLNGNLYYSKITQPNFKDIERWTPFGKSSINFKILKGNPKSKWKPNVTFQIQLAYQGRSNIPPGGNAGENGFNTGNRRFGEITSSQQGFIESFYTLDAGVNISFLKRRASLNISMSDILKTRRNNVSYLTDFAIQQNNFIRDWRVIGINFSYRFGDGGRSPSRKGGKQKRFKDQSSDRGDSGGLGS